MENIISEKIELKSEDAEIHVKVPKRVLHFSDGTIEEFTDSETEEEPTEPDKSNAVATPQGWGPWLLFKLQETGSTTLHVCDYVGEGLASFFGITSPKYQYEIEEYQRIQAEEKERESQAVGWTQPSSSVANNAQIATEQPAPTPV